MMKRLLCLLTGAVGLCLGAQAQTAVKDTAQSHITRPASLGHVAAPLPMMADSAAIEFEYEDVISL